MKSTPPQVSTANQFRCYSTIVAALLADFRHPVSGWTDAANLRRFADRLKAGSEPDVFVGRKHQALGFSVDGGVRDPVGIATVEQGLARRVPVDEERLLTVAILEVAVIGLELVAIDRRRLPGARGMVIRDGKERLFHGVRHGRCAP